MVTHWEELPDRQRVKVAPVPFTSYQRKMQEDKSPIYDESLQCACGRERFEIQLVFVHDWRGDAA